MTWQEQFGMVLAEAIASGKPVISTLSDSIPEVVGDAEVLIPAGDYKALADTIIEFMENKSLRENFSGKGIERAEKMFKNEKIAEELYEVINNM